MTYRYVAATATAVGAAGSATKVAGARVLLVAVVVVVVFIGDERELEFLDFVAHAVCTVNACSVTPASTSPFLYPHSSLYS